jgi:hypothetical protein
MSPTWLRRLCLGLASDREGLHESNAEEESARALAAVDAATPICNEGRTAMKSCKRRATKDYKAAIHEAGHVVVALGLGRRFNFVELGEAPIRLLNGTMSTRGGRVNHGDEPISFHDEVVELWGGVAACKIFRPRHNWFYYILTGGMEDMACIKAAREKYNADPRGKFIVGAGFTENMKMTAVGLLKMNWPSVIKVADALVAKRRLTYDEVIDVLHG